MDFYDRVVRHTWNPMWTYVGWGTDSVWPALLHYPRDRVAVIDAVCMVRRGGVLVGVWVSAEDQGELLGWGGLSNCPAFLQAHIPTEGGLGHSGKPGGIYRPGLSPYTAKQEEMIVFAVRAPPF
jgi:hypothetical protein